MILAILTAATVLSGDPDRLGWMTGAWVQKTEDSLVQETWLAADAFRPQARERR